MKTYFYLMAGTLCLLLIMLIVFGVVSGAVLYTQLMGGVAL